MMSNINIDSQGLENIVEKLEQKVEKVTSLWEDVKKEMKNIDGGENSCWKGKAQESVYQSYKTIFPSLEIMLEGFQEKNIYLRKTIKNYRLGEQKIDSEIERNQNDLKVN